MTGTDPLPPIELTDAQWAALCEWRDYGDFWIGDEDDDRYDLPGDDERFAAIEGLLHDISSAFTSLGDPSLAMHELGFVTLHAISGNDSRLHLALTVKVPYGPTLTTDDPIPVRSLHDSAADPSGTGGHRRARYALNELIGHRNRLLGGLADYIVREDDGRHGTPR